MVKVYLIVDGHGQVRLAKRRPKLDWDEVAYPVVVAIPQGWGCVYEQMEITLAIPEPPNPPLPYVGDALETDSESEPEPEGEPV